MEEVLQLLTLIYEQNLTIMRQIGVDAAVIEKLTAQMKASATPLAESVKNEENQPKAQTTLFPQQEHPYHGST